MKRTATVGMIFLCLFLSSCTDGKTLVVSPDLAKAASEAEAEVDLIQYRIRDDDLWKSVYREADLIEATIEDSYLTSVSFKLSTLEGRTIILEDLYTFRLIDSDDLWCKLTINQIIYALVTSDEVIEAEANGEALSVESTILKWTDSSTEVNQTASICDSNGDGHWDHVCEGRMYFTTPSSATVIPADESGYGIGNTSTDSPKIFEVADDARLSSLSEFVFS